ncbi:alpha-L-arabinofuranosidase C-terminal domain-containing protein [Wenyingzhuangia sp. IMCC45467]
MKNKLKSVIALALVCNFFAGQAQTQNLELDLSTTVAKIQPTMYGVFFEDINFAADGGLYAELIKNRSFEFTKDPFMGWREPNSNRHSFNYDSGKATIIKHNTTTANHNFIRIKINNDKGYSLINEGFRGVGLKENAMYNFSVSAANSQRNINKIIVEFIDNDDIVLGKTEIAPNSTDWKNYTAQITSTKTEAKAKIKLTFKGVGEIDLDMISLFPVDTWKGRKNGLRKDIVQLLYDLQPGFVRFPGGCIVEGSTIERRYQWKKTVGPIADRELQINRWNTEFKHKLTPDYYQSLGLGFFEYFLLSEDLGAEALPILSCGIACQYNSGELVPLDELDPYVQDALDLIEFANGSVDSAWGKIRSEMGHPKPFNLKYIGVGNEQWGPAYIERYKIIAEAVKTKYPEITIVSGSGPSPDGAYFEYGMKELKKLNAEIVDEHYYKSPEWFKENADRYDSYDRNGPKIFAGEYAAHPKGVADGYKENNWLAALSEAAFMTGLERNADVVTLTSYAPLMAHVEAYQWAPDMIWFNNLQSYGTANYQVQKLFANNAGTDLLTITKNGKPLTGQEGLYASATKDVNKKEVVVKLVNTLNKNQNIAVNLSGERVKSKGTKIVLTSENLEDVNSFEEPYKIIPTTSVFKLIKKKVILNLEPNSLTILKLKQ